MKQGGNVWGSMRLKIRSGGQDLRQGRVVLGEVPAVLLVGVRVVWARRRRLGGALGFSFHRKLVGQGGFWWG